MVEKSLIPLIVQDLETKQVLCLFYCNEDSIRLMRETGFVWRFSRRTGKQVKKGETSGNLQKLVKLTYDCDSDALLAVVKQQGSGACHLNRWSCFSKSRLRSWNVLDELCTVIGRRRKSPREGSFVASIINKPRALGKKLLEEAKELEEALLKKPDEEVVWEAADLIFFTLLTLENRRIDIEEVLRELRRRRK